MSSSSGLPTPPGWYPQDGQLRYWDGRQWTAATAPLAPDQVGSGAVAPARPQSTNGRPWYRKKRVLIPVAGVLVVGAISQLTGGGGADTEAVPVSDVVSSHAAGTTPSSSPSASAAPSATSTPTPRATSTTPRPAAKPAPQLGKPVRDGKFEFVVTSMKCGIARVGNQYLNKVAQGQFCAVSVKVTNIGDEPQSMFADNQYAFDAKGRQFAASSEASLYADDSKLLFEEINPGNSLSGRVYFDVPKSDSPIRLELHDSVFSGGVGVRLT